MADNDRAARIVAAIELIIGRALDKAALHKAGLLGEAYHEITSMLRDELYGHRAARRRRPHDCRLEFRRELRWSAGAPTHRQHAD